MPAGGLLPGPVRKCDVCNAGSATLGAGELYGPANRPL